MENVEHENLLHRVAIEHKGRNSYAVIDGTRRKVYPTGNPQEPWTTNISKARVPVG